MDINPIARLHTRLPYEWLNFYIATRLERAVDHNRVRDALHALGHRITYDWTTHGSVQRCGPERIREVALAEKRGVGMADVVIVLLPGGRGTHAELGLALAWDKIVLLHAPEEGGFMAQDERTCAFYHDPLVHALRGDLYNVVECMTPHRMSPERAAIGPWVPRGD